MPLYRSLNTDQDEIRLLDILPGDLETPVQCDMRYASLTPGLDFTALSYTWGDPKYPEPIAINGHRLDVTINLYTALRYLRDSHRVRTFWVDAVCINQNDLQERAAQVLRMCDIYTLAKSVEVWLGEEEDEFDAEAMQLVAELGATVPDAEQFLCKGMNDSHRERFMHCFAESTPDKLKALGRLFKRPWWTRIWIVQELSLAQQGNAVMRCGKYKSTWWNFLVAAYAIDEFWNLVIGSIGQKCPDETLEGHQHGIRLAQCRNVDPALPGFTLLELLNQHRDCAATDPRDKVYGLLGLAGDVATIGLKPSYTATPEDIFIDLFRKHVTATGTLDMLCEVRYPKKLTGLPSWVPDWSTDQTVPGICIHTRYMGGNHFEGSPIDQYQEYRAAGDSRAEVQFNSNSMTLTAFNVGAITYIGEVDSGMTLEDLEVIESLGMLDATGYSGSACDTFNDWCNMMLKCLDWDKIGGKYGADNALEVYCRTLIGDRNGRMMRPRASASSDEINVDDEVMTNMEDSSDHELEQQEHGTDDDEDSQTSIPLDVEGSRLFSPMEMLNMSAEGYRSCLLISFGKRFAILDSGHVGIIPGNARVSDAVFVALGCSVPLVVRKESSGSVLVGECYVHGAMNGEALQGTPEMLTLT